MATPASIAERFWRKVNKAPGLGPRGTCWEWTGDRLKGYGRVFVDGKRKRAHRVAWEMVHGPVPDGMDVLHECDNRPCVRDSHVFLGTNAENVADRHSKGRTSLAPRNTGTENPNAKVSETDVREIRSSRDPLRVLAARFGLTKRSVVSIRSGRTWSHVT